MAVGRATVKILCKVEKEFDLKEKEIGRGKTMLEITYHREGDYLMPNIIGEKIPKSLTRWGRAKLEQMEKEDSIIVEHLRFRGTLWEKILAVQDEADMMEEKLTKQLMENCNVTEELKEAEWVRLTTQIQAEVEKTIMEEIICK